jgi:hypothetical protein
MAAIMRSLLALLASLAVTATLAAPVSQRSPFLQGHWWNPERSGSGFQVFNTADQVAVVWYTFDESMRPVWYTAQGARAGLGRDAWPLMRHRWVNGQRVGTTVGTMTLTVKHFELLELRWDFGNQVGTWLIQPLRLGGVESEIDHTGSWFDPTNSGWGLGLSEHGGVLGGALFTYDAAGEPTWVAGFARQSGKVEMFAVSGSCPYCDYRASTSRAVGSLGIEFASETRMTVRNRLDVAMASGLRIDGAELAQLSPAASTHPADRQLATFDSEAALKAYFDESIGRLGARYGAIDFSPGPAATATFSSTNLQEAGVDEADLVKSDGQVVYTYSQANTSSVTPPTGSIRVAEVFGEGTGLQVRGTVPISAAAPNPYGPGGGLYLYNDKLVSVVSPSPVYYSDFTPAPSGWLDGATQVDVFRTSPGALPTSLWRLKIDGYLVSSRRIGDRLYILTRFAPSIVGYQYGASTAEAIEANRQLLARTPLSAYLPGFQVNGGEKTPALDATSVYLAPQGGAGAIAHLVMVTAIDLREPLRVAQTLAVTGNVDTMYVSTDNLYLATSRYLWRGNNGIALPEPSFYVTDVHQVRLGATGASIVATGTVEGSTAWDFEKAPFRFSEYQGRLRVMTSSTLMWGTTEVNRLTILEPSTITPGLLKTVSYLPNERRPETIGKPGEVMYSNRFLADRLYAVTFKKIDPLYVVDLSDASDPRIAGALDMPGFSEYLHPLPNGLLLGFGKDAKIAEGGGRGDGQFAWYQGLQLSLFDVSDAGRPRELQRIVMGKRGSDSALLKSHHAFAEVPWSASLREIALPARIHDGDIPGAQDNTPYPWKESGLMRFQLQGSTPADARLMQLPKLISSTPDRNLNDGAEYSGRSIILRNGTVYVGNGQFWRQDGAGNVIGPF